MGGDDKGLVGRTTELEFGGILGAPFMIFGLPLAVYGINLGCTKESCTVLSLPSIPTDISAYFDWRVTWIFLGWFLFQVVLSLLPVGNVVEGQVLRTGKKLKYRCNGFVAMVISLGAFSVFVYLGYPVTYVYDKFLPLITTAMVFSFVLSVLLYFKSQTVPNQELAVGGNSGNVLYDFFIGHELNPRLGPIDLKFFCELRPGLIGWVILDVCFVVKSYEMTGKLDPALLLVSGFHAFYVADALWFEEAILTTMDIVHDGFGFMLVFGDLVWVPFLYSLQARFLLEYPQQWAIILLAGILMLNMVGYAIFRGSNSQKNEFRKDPYNPSLIHLETMPTASGRKLLISGWWGLCRHPNYLGDLIMSLAWSLPSGFQYIMPYFYPIYFLCLLVHRNARDEHSCKKKYGKDWDKYCSKVKYRIFPYIY